MSRIAPFDHLPRPLSPQQPLEMLRYHWYEDGLWLPMRGSGWRLSLLLDGCLDFGYDGGGEAQLQPGWLAVLPAGLAYRMRASSRQGVVELRLCFEASFAARSLAQDRRQLGSEHPWPALPCCYRLQRSPPLDDLVSGVLNRPLDAYSAGAWWRMLSEWSRPTAAPGDRLAALPAWLRNAIAGLDGSAVLREGVQALTRLSGRSLDHCTRVLRRHGAPSATALLNRRRLETVAEQLRQSDRSIDELCAAVGFGNRRHFYDLFKARYGCTPARYRAGRTAGRSREVC